MSTRIAPGGGVTTIDTQVYQAAKADAWEDLDLTSVIGTRDGMVCILIENDSGTAAAIRFRPNGRTENIYSASGYSSVSGCFLANGANGKGFVILPHISGIVEWISNQTGGTVTLTVIAAW